MTETLTRLPRLPLSVVRRIYREAASAYRNNCDGDVRDIARYRLRQEQLGRLVRQQAAALTAARAERNAALLAARYANEVSEKALDEAAAALRERDALAAQLARTRGETP